MDLRLTDEQEMLLKASTEFLAARYPRSRVRDPQARPDADYRRQAAELGWYGLLVGEDLGGGSLSGEPVVDCALLARALGAQLQPGPFLGTALAALALAADGSPEQHRGVLADLLAGRSAAAWAVVDAGGDPAPTAGVSARRAGEGGYTLHGAKTAVEGAGDSDLLLVTGTSEAGPTQFLVPRDAPGVSVQELEGLDITRRFAEVTFADVAVGPEALVGAAGGAGGLVDRMWDIACVLTVADMVGAMERDFAAALEYSGQRIAFGRPIGSFQAVKHLLADTSLLLEMSNALLFAAARAVGSGASDGARLTSMAKSFVSDSGVDLVHNCFQVFGGIGFTWEHDQHLYLRRVTTDAALFGDAVSHRERICVLAGL
ncbi:acyl-CoA dehydrogenase family protein [Pseudonocardia ailaonensis]|uniref:Acyl-CoA dehydrogenase family protein n=1 Tax=Pseudonocardia ailaonensis TaxID=367279 RepID=A0ABN2ML07_9PSEU